MALPQGSWKLGIPTIQSDRVGGTNTESVMGAPRQSTLQEQLNQTAKPSKSLGGGGGFGAPALNLPSSNQQFQVFTPDYDALDQSFQGILDSYGAYRDALGSQAETGREDLRNQLDYLLGNIEDARGKNRQALDKSRATISEDAFMRERNLQAQMSSRGLTGSGLEQLGGIQERMQTGKNVSDVANAYYESETELIKQIEQGQKNYNTALQTLNNSLQSALAQLLSQESSSRMDYTQMRQNLERQVIQDANQALQAQRDYEMQVQQLQMQRSQMAQSAKMANLQYQMMLEEYEASKQPGQPTPADIQDILHSPMTDTQKKAYLQTIGLDASDANMWLDTYKYQQTQTQAGQIAGMRQAGVPESEIQAYIQNLAMGGANIDYGTLTGSGTTSTTKKSGTGLGMFVDDKVQATKNLAGGIWNIMKGVRNE